MCKKILTCFVIVYLSVSMYGSLLASVCEDSPLEGFSIYNRVTPESGSEMSCHSASPNQDRDKSKQASSHMDVFQMDCCRQGASCKCPQCLTTCVKIPQWTELYFQSHLLLTKSNTLPNKIDSLQRQIAQTIFHPPRL